MPNTPFSNSSPAIEAMALGALHRQIKKQFNLDPVTLAAGILKSAQRDESAVDFGRKLAVTAQTVFMDRLHEAFTAVKAGVTEKPLSGGLEESITNHFGLHPNIVSAALRKQVAEDGVTPEDAAAAIRNIIGPIVKKVFDEAIAIVASKS